MPSLAELGEVLTAKRTELHDIFEEAGADVDLERVTLLQGDTAAKAAQIKARNDELSDLGREFDRLALLDQIGKNNTAELGRLGQPKSAFPFPTGGGNGSRTQAEPVQQLRAFLRDHPALKAVREGKAQQAQIELPNIDFKTLITLTTISPQNQRRSMVDMALEERTIADLMLESNIDRGTVEYYEETTVTNAATTVSEGGTKPESALAWTLRTETARKIGTFIPATSESLDDNAALEGQIRGRLAYMVRRVEEAQLLNGDGNAPNIRGLLNRSGLQTQAKGADPTPDTVYKAMQKIRGASGAGFAEPTGVIFHPNDWTDIKLLRTADGIYIWGNPADSAPDRIWGLDVRQTTAMTEGTGLVGAFRPHAEVLRRTGITITISTEHGTFFVENKVAILAEERLTLAVYRPSAFCTLTGI
jgi:HK97 family phage major capsid protein